LAGMRERTEQMGGTLTVISSRGRGTKIVVTLPNDRERISATNGGVGDVKTPHP